MVSTLTTENLFNSFTLRSKQYLISPNNVTSESNIKVIRIKEKSSTKEAIDC